MTELTDTIRISTTRGLTKPLTLTVVSHKHFWCDPEGYKVQGGFGKQIESLAPFFDKILLAVPVQQESDPKPGYTLTQSNIIIYPLPYFRSITSWSDRIKFLLKTPILLWHIARLVRRGDVTHIRLPGYVELYSFFFSCLARTPMLIYLAGDWAERIRSVRESLLRRLIADGAGWMLNVLLRDKLVFAVAGAPCTSKKRHTIVTTVIDNEMIVSHDDIRAMLQEPVRILYVGRLTGEKGLFFLIKALAILIKQKLPVELDLVGTGPLQDTLVEQARIHGIADHIHFHGYIPLGPELLQKYHEADIFVLPSLSEGQAKVLLEAMASGVPVIATAVGGNPSLVKHKETGLLVPSRDATALADAIKCLLRDHSLRRTIIYNGIELAAQNTTEHVVAKMVQEFENEYWPRTTK